MEEEAEEEHEFEEDEEVEDEATADAATADAATTDAATADAATTDAATADAATTDAATTEAATADADAADAGTAGKENELKLLHVVRRVRGKRSAEHAASPFSTPSPVQPRRLFSASSVESLGSSTDAKSSRKRQATISSFFSPGSEDRKVEDEPALPPLKRALTTKDTIRALIASGVINEKGSLIKPSEELVQSLADDVYDTVLHKEAMQNRGGRPVKEGGQRRGTAGGLRTNMRLKSQKSLKDELPVAFKHEICLHIAEMKIEEGSEKHALAAASRKYKMKLKKMKSIWLKRSEWKMQMQKYKLSAGQHIRPGSSGAMKGSHGKDAAKQNRMRASGGGRKLTFPELYKQTKIWLEEERSHGHTVLRKHVGWRFMELLAQHKKALQEKKDACTISASEGIELHAAVRMLESMESNENRLIKRAEHLISWMGAKCMQPNLVTQLSEIEQQIRAELTWNHHDYQISKIARMQDEDYKEMFSRPDQAKLQKMSCALCFSDQVPLWVKKPSSKEVFANWEIKTSANAVKIHRRNISQKLDEKAKQKALADQEEGDETKDDQQIVEHEGDEDDWHIAKPDEKAESGKKHLTTMREANVDKYRITFEAHQMVSGFFNPDEDPKGHVLPGILIVPGPHAALSNMSESGEWINEEQFYHCGQMRTHKAGNSVGRTLEPWRRLRKSHPHLLRHFYVYSQPSSNTDGVIMSWIVRDMSSRLGMRLHQRDMFGAAFVDEVRQMQFLGHEVASNIMSKMTAAMQLTDTDFAHEFKSRVKHQVDEIMRAGMAKQRQDEAAPSDHYKMSIKDVATAIDAAMEHMVQKNEKDQWVLAGLRRNGFLVLRPNEKGQLIYQSKQNWCKHLPIGSTRISEDWLKNRMSWIKDAGRSVDPPNWERIAGAKELADLIEWSYQHQEASSNPSNEAVMTLESENQPEWVAAGNFQLPLELRRQLAMKEKSLTEEAHERRKKIRQKRQDKKMRAEAKKILTEEQKEEIRSTLASKSRSEAMQQLVPSAKNPTAKKVAKKALKQKKKMANMTDEKKKHKSQQKQLVKQALKSEAVKALKQKQAMEKHEAAHEPKKSLEKQQALEANEPSHAEEAPLPPPSHPPPPPEMELPSGKFRIVSEHAGMTLYGRQGSVLNMGETQMQLLLEKDLRNSIERVAWVNKKWLQSIDCNKAWQMPQASLSRQIRQHILLHTGTVSEDIDDEFNDDVELVGKDVHPSGIDGMHILYGWHFLKYMVQNKKFDEIPGIQLLDPSLCCPLALPSAQQHHEPELLEKLRKVLVHKMGTNEDTFLIPLAAGGHWSLLVINKGSGKIRYYDSLAGSDEKADIGTMVEIQNLPERCLAMAETLLGLMMDWKCIDESILHQPGLSRENVKCRQPWGSNLCGHFVLAYIEKEVGQHTQTHTHTHTHIHTGTTE